MPDTKSPLIQALNNRRKSVQASDSDGLLEQILAQVTRMAELFAQDKEEEKNVRTQESHTP